MLKVVWCDLSFYCANPVCMV